MRHSSLKAKRTTASPDRKLIIAIVILTSALSFTLGYFVGKAGEKEKQSQYQTAAAPPKIEAVPQVQEQPDSLNEPQSAIASQPVIAASGGSAEREKEEAQPEKPLIVQPPAKKESAKPKMKDDTSQQSDIKYTVQAGAFKNLKEAEILKHKLETKGYKAYIKKYAASKNPKLYKVRTGEFTAKEEAAALALKMKKEGLKAFVTLKNEDAHGDKPRAAKKENVR